MISVLTKYMFYFHDLWITLLNALFLRIKVEDFLQSAFHSSQFEKEVILRVVVVVLFLCKNNLV